VLVAGPNGAGKTTLLHLISASRADAGPESCSTGGRSSTAAWMCPPNAGAWATFRGLGVFPHLDVLGNVAFGLGHLPRAERRDRAGAWLTNWASPTSRAAASRSLRR